MKRLLDLPRVFLLDPAEMVKMKARVAAGDRALKPALDSLIADADKALKTAPTSVMEKTLVPSSGDKHDYHSLAPYFWPDPARPGGLPYIRRDGEHNPEADGPESDAPRFGRMTKAVETLALASYLTGREPYAEQATRLVRVWFLDPATRMNPNLNYGQAIRGVNEGRGIGIIETAGRLPGVLESVGLLAAGSRAWTAKDQAGMVDWTRRYLEWLQTSKNGRDEQKAQNNHGTYYDVELASLALFVGRPDLAKRVLESAKQARIAAQIEPDGKMPRELARTKSLGYSVMNLRGLENLAALGERVGVDLWRFQTADGRGIRRAVDFLLPFADPDKKWPYQQITKSDRASLLPLMWQAYRQYGADTYRDVVMRAAQQNSALRADRAWLLNPLADKA